MKTAELEKALIVGVKIKIGKNYSEYLGGKLKEGEIIELIEGYFDYDNGLYCETQTTPSIKLEGDYESIYHLFGNDLEDFMDCEILNQTK